MEGVVAQVDDLHVRGGEREGEIGRERERGWKGRTQASAIIVSYN
jgi:hypothetical protein